MYKINTNSNLNYNDFNNKYKTKSDCHKQEMLNYPQNNMINEDINKMHLVPPNCPMTPKSYTQFFNTNKNTNTNANNVSVVAPYKLELVKHPREGYKYTMEYNNFYNDWDKGALHYTSSNNEFLDTNNTKTTKNTPSILTNSNSENIKLYKETKPHNEFATPMNINGSNKVADLFDNCMNKKTFEYKRYSTISPHHKQWLDNPLFTSEISQDTEKLKNNYMNSREESNMNLYSSVFEDMYIMTKQTNNNFNFSNSSNIKKVEDELKNYNISSDYSNKQIQETDSKRLNLDLDKRIKDRSYVIKPTKSSSKRNKKT